MTTDKWNLKGRFPFRLGTTSFILPAGLVPNVQFLGPLVDDVELILFESHEISELPDGEEVERLNELAAEHDLTYTVHLPLDTRPGSGEETKRRATVEKYRRVIDRMRPLRPFGWVLHFHGDQPGAEPSRDLERWRDALRRSAGELLETGVEPRQICVESIDYALPLIDGVIHDYDFSVCLDLGHVIKHGHSVDDHLSRYLPRTRVIHLHGVRDGRDHCDLCSLEPALLSDLLSRLIKDSGVPRVLTLEVFKRDALERSLDVLKERVF